MAQRRSSLGFLGMFGRSGDLRQLDAALRDADLHPALVPEGVKLTLVNLMKDHWSGEPPPQAYPQVARLFGYCIAGPDTFERAHGLEQRLDAERRIEAALEAGDSFDAQIVLMALHAKLINAEVVESYGLGAD
jgi:tryptophan 2,3-dioxygenase